MKTPSKKKTWEGLCKKFFFLPMILLMVFLSACNQEVATENPQRTRASYKTISPKQAKERLDSNENVLLLDVRTQAEFEDSHVPGSILIPVDQLRNKAETILTNKDTPIFVICRSGSRSKTATRTLLSLGYQDVYDLGGILNWPYQTQ
jgi:phage shock protein E